MQYSIVNINDIRKNIDSRIDAEYYHPKILESMGALEKKNSCRLKDCAKFIVGPFGSTVTKNKYIDYSEFKYIRNKDINRFVIEDFDPVYISGELYKSLKQFHIKKDDLLITVVGTLGKVAIAQIKDTKSIFSCKSTIIRSHNINPFYLATYLNSKAGHLFSIRGKRGAIQEGLNLSDLKTIEIFVPNTNFQKIIEKLIQKSIELMDISNNLYLDAESALLKEIELMNWRKKLVQSFIINYSYTRKSDRLDAEYYQPMCEEIENKIKEYSNGCFSVEEIVNLKNENFKPEDNMMYKYIELSNILSSGEIKSSIESSGKELPTRARREVKQNDVIISSIEGSLESIALITRSDKNLLCSTGFFVVNSKEINSESLFVFFKSYVGQLQLKKRCNGTILTAISKDEFKKIVIPKIKKNAQNFIKTKIQEMYKSKQTSKELLEIAKKGVEFAIETEEEQAIKWIYTELENLKIDIK